ncbi:hypothetical protein Tco_1577241 [Tanacetum coccineum]
MEIDKTGKADNLIKYAMYDCQNELITTQSALMSLLLLWGRYMVQILNLIVPNVGAPALHKSVLRCNRKDGSSSSEAQLETKFKKLELLLGRELPPPPSHQADRSG